MKSTFDFSNEQNNAIYNILCGVKENPYEDYFRFSKDVRSVAVKQKVPDFLINVCDQIRVERREEKRHAHLLRNVPLDKHIPVFDQNDPVTDKYTKKTTFIGEAFLELFAQLTDTPLMAYETRNNGDFFHDVYAQKKYSQTQTQKTDGELYFHNDRAAHPVRADFLSLLGMHGSDVNRIYTGYIDGRGLLDHISETHQALLRKPFFVTPYDEYSRDSNRTQVMSEQHAVLYGEHCFRYFDTRTTYVPGAPIDAIDALLSMKSAVVRAHKERVHVHTGDLFSFANQEALHNRELAEIHDREDARKRWLLKTYSFRDTASLMRFSDYYDQEQPGFVKESETVN